MGVVQTEDGSALGSIFNPANVSLTNRLTAAWEEEMKMWMTLDDMSMLYLFLRDCCLNAGGLRNKADDEQSSSALFPAKNLHRTNSINMYVVGTSKEQHLSR